MATYMVLRIMKNNSKKQKLSTKDHVSHEDESKTNKDGVESSENDVQVRKCSEELKETEETYGNASRSTTSNSRGKERFEVTQTY
ncbi:hypothetical protein GIB67_031767 [Kingdonia uniflora]|uniref:Uncharacterized protein n=1 Tax=Kingdonia uniflora TaxID=39325 RepID=A0A7J7NW50_9MAGN|nr:hypothetical protein GIB67_031767 [Kingdonia uniflora]